MRALSAAFCALLRACASGDGGATYKQCPHLALALALASRRRRARLSSFVGTTRRDAAADSGGGASAPAADASHVPLRKELKAAARVRKEAGRQRATSQQGDDASPQTATKSNGTVRSGLPAALLTSYELTVGLEIHAELSTSRKLFSQASTADAGAPPNRFVAPFDAALPGAQPQFQQATLLPAIRAALALGCEIKNESGWDRKHYFWWDQPQGYQITQYYEPFAVDGCVSLAPNPDGVPEFVTIGIKQIQMEQDTAKTILQPPSDHLLDFNRVSHPLIEIITLPHIHDPITAAAFVRKVQRVLKAVGACETGMEMGGLRVDVNVSVRKIGVDGEKKDTSSYAGLSGLGQRTEIKNLSSLAGISTAIALERDRQVEVLESGGTVVGETRGWTLGARQTHRLRGKEGEVDYRYMPDPDLAPLIIGQDLVEHLKETLPPSPEAVVTDLVTAWGVVEKDAWTLVDLDDGERCDFFYNIAHRVLARAPGSFWADRRKIGKKVCNWVVHELGAVLSASPIPNEFCSDDGKAKQLAEVICLLQESQITLPIAKALLEQMFSDSENPYSIGVAVNIGEYIDRNALRMQAMTDQEYLLLAQRMIEENPKMANDAVKDLAKQAIQAPANATSSSLKRKSTSGKVMWFVGQMVRQDDAGRVQPDRAEYAVKSVLTASAVSAQQG